MDIVETKDDMHNASQEVGGYAQVTSRTVFFNGKILIKSVLNSFSCCKIKRGVQSNKTFFLHVFGVMYAIPFLNI